MHAGQLIQDRYELRDSIGTGGMADVWRARDGHLGRDVAVKFLASRLAEDPEFLVRFFGEAQAVARISHPNVVQVLDFGEHDGAPYLVMEYVGGGSVDDLTGAPQPPDKAVALIAAVARGAGAAHDSGIVHRDLKPGNILLDDDGTPKIADFGIAASTRSERLTATGAAIGSPHYISPEQATGGDATPASDVYALGVVLYELVTGVKLFDADNVTAIAIAHVDRSPRPPSELADVPPDIEAIVMRCLAKDPDERFASGTELAAALDAVAIGAPEPLQSDTAVAMSERTTPGWFGRRAAIGTTLVLIVVGALAVAVMARGDGPERADGSADKLEDVGDLGRKRSPTPTTDADFATSKEPSPTPTKKKEKEESDGTGSGAENDSTGSGGSGSGGGGSGGGGSNDPEPTPEPEPTDAPTPDANPTPQPSP